MKVTIQKENSVEFIKDVTKVRTYLALDCFSNYIEIWQGKKKKTFKECDIFGFEVETY